MSKRQFPYYSAIPEIEIKRRDFGANAGQDIETNPNIYQPGQGFGDRQEEQGTDFSRWTEQQIKDFLDKRGEDYDDCQGFGQLVQRAAMCEYNTGPAQPPAGFAAEAEVDPLDAFMAEINQDAVADAAAPKTAKQGLDLDEEEDHVADYMQIRRQNGAAAAAAAVAGQDYNSDEEVYATARAVDASLDAQDDMDETAALMDSKRKIEALPALDHASIQYPDFEKNFYDEAPEIAALTPAQVNERRRQLGIRVSGFDAPKPVETFRQCGFDALLMGAIIKAGYQKPTGIQSQALPAALSGRDVLGIAKTGSGKTAAFVLPMLVHIMDQAELDKGAGPIGVIVAPTRELSEQIHKETRKFSKPYNLRVCAAFGGLSKYEQFKDLKAGSEVAVCTPGRMIDLLKMKACNFLRATYLVFDEADRMFDMGFEPQVRSIIGQMRPDRQTLLFSATMPNKVERLVRDALTSPVRVTVGEVGAANEDIKQVVEVVDEVAKLGWLTSRLADFIDQGDVLVFANQKAKVDEVNGKLQSAGIRSVAIHGDMDQHSRMAVLADFKAGRHHVLVATDVAARGLDIRSVKTVVNYDVAKEIDTHVHRVGRTGRAGDRDGVAYTLVTPREARIAGELVTSLVAANQEVPAALVELAKKDGAFRKKQPGARGERGGGRGRGRRVVGGAGLGFGDPKSSDRGNNATESALPASLMGRGLGTNQSGFEAGFSKGGYESTVEGTAVPSAGGTGPPAAPAAVPSAYRADPPGGAPPAQQGVWGGRGAVSMFQNRFKTSFVASGTTGGDVDQRPTIVAPRVQPQRAVPPPPVPVAMAPAVANPGAQQAIDAAKVIAARLSASAVQATSSSFPPATTGVQPSYPPPPPLPQSSARNAPPPFSYHTPTSVGRGGGGFPPPASYNQPSGGGGFPPPASYNQPSGGGGFAPPASYNQQPPPRNPGFSSGAAGFSSGAPGFSSGAPGFSSGALGFSSGPPGVSAEGRQTGFSSGPPGVSEGQPTGFSSEGRRTGFSSGPPGVSEGRHTGFSDAPAGGVTSHVSHGVTSSSVTPASQSEAIARAQAAAQAVAARLLSQAGKGSAEAAPSGFSADTGQAFQWSSGRGGKDMGREGSQRKR